MNYSTATPAEMDEVLFPLWADRWYQAERVNSYRHEIAATVWKEAYTARYGVREARRGINQYQLNQWNGLLHEAEAKLAEIQSQIAPIDAEYERRGGWNRFVLVGNNNGHIHKGQCSTLRMTTRILLLSQASGMNDTEVVDTFSYTACTKCFPDAPVAPAPALDPSICTGSGTFARDVNGSMRLYRAWGECTTCGYRVSTTSLGNARKHKKPVPIAGRDFDADRNCDA